MVRRRDSLTSMASHSSIKSTTSSQCGKPHAKSVKKPLTHKVSMVKKYQCSYPGCTFERNGKKHNIERHVWLQHIRKTLAKSIPYSAQSHRDLVKNWIVLVKNPTEGTTGHEQAIEMSTLQAHLEYVGDDQHSNDSGFEHFSRAESVASDVFSYHEHLQRRQQPDAVHMRVDSCSDWESCDEISTPAASLKPNAYDKCITHNEEWPRNTKAGVSGIVKHLNSNPTQTQNKNKEISHSSGLTAQSVQNIPATSNPMQHSTHSIPYRDREPHWEFEIQRVGGYHYEDPCGYFASPDDESPQFAKSKRQRQWPRPSSRKSLARTHEQQLLWRPYIAH